MRRHLRVQAGPALGLALALTAGVAAADALAAGRAWPAPATQARPPLASLVRSTPRQALARPATARQLLLINGDQLVVTSADGRTGIALRAAHRPDAFVRLPCQGQLLEVPVAALPYLGRGLSPVLFEPRALEKAESGGRLPVQVSFTGRRPAIPGLTATRLAAGVTDGYLTPASAAAFGAALRRQSLADRATGRPGTGGLLPGGVSITLAGAPRPTAALALASHVRKYQLTVHGTDLKGRPDTGDEIFVFSVDNGQPAFTFPPMFSHGIARFRVPAGHYWAMAIFNSAAAERIVVRPQFTVPARPTTLRLAAASATSEFTTHTPRPAANIYTLLEIDRGARVGSGDGFGVGWAGGTGWINPTHRRPTVGTLRVDSTAVLLSPRSVTPAYAYNLNLPGPPGVIPPQHFTVRRANLSAVTNRYYQDPATRKGGWLVESGTPTEPGGGPIVGFRMPAVITQYLSSGPRLKWELLSYYVLKPDILYLALGDFAGFRSYAAGHRQTQDWNEYPLHPQPDTRPPGAPGNFPTQTSAARFGNRLHLIMTPFSDNQPGHVGAGFTGYYLMPVSGSYLVDQNGRTIARGNALSGIPDIALSARPSVVSFTLTAARHYPLFPLSAASRTTWTWRSAPDPSARVPAGWYCYRKHGYQRQCAVQPLLTLNYAVNGLSLGGQTRPGHQVIEVTAGHIQLGGSAPITGARAQVSFDGGRTWRTAAVTAQGHGRFRIGFSAPAGVDVTLRVSARDAAGGTITETITNGYAVSA